MRQAIKYFACHYLAAPLMGIVLLAAMPLTARSAGADDAASPSGSASPVLTVAGGVSVPLKLSRGDLEKMTPQISAYVHYQTRHGVIEGMFTGVPISVLLAQAKPSLPAGRSAPLRLVILAQATDRYAVSVSAAEADPEIAVHPAFIAIAKDGQPIAPCLVLPDDHKASRLVHDLMLLRITALTD